MSKDRKYYQLEFKEEAVALAERLGNDSEAARQLGIHSTLIHQWRKRLGKWQKESEQQAMDPASELARLRKENSDLKKVNEILKRAAAFFSQDHLK